MKSLSVIFLFSAAGFLNAQTYNYDAARETLVITGNGNSGADLITPKGPTTPGSTVPGSSEIFGNTTTIILEDVWTSPDYIRIKYVEPNSAGNNTTIKLVNSTLQTSGDFDKGGNGQTLILDAKSELVLFGNHITNTVRIENEGYIETTTISISESSYMWDNKTSTGCSGVLGGRGYYSCGNVSSIDTSKDFGLIKSRGQITDLAISGEYRVDGNSAKTIGNDSFIVGVNSADVSGGGGIKISGKLTVEAKQGSGIGILANQLGSSDVSLKNDYSGEIIVKAKNAFGVKVGGNAAKDATATGDIYQISIGTLNVECTASGSDTGEATGIYAKSVKRELTASSITVKGNTDAAGIQLTEGGRNLSITDMKVSSGGNGTATGILAAGSAGTSSTGDLENIDVGNLEVSGGANAAGILAKSISGKVKNITVSSETGNAYGLRADNDLKLTLLDGAKISATAENGESYAVRSENADVDLNFSGTATITGNVAAKMITISNGISAVINGNVEGESLAAGAKISTVSGKMKFDTVADLTITTSVGSLEIGEATGAVSVDTVETSANISNAVSVAIKTARGGITATNVSNGLTVGDAVNLTVSGTNVTVLDGKTVSGDIISATDLTLTTGGSATIAGTVSAGTNRLVMDGVFEMTSSAPAVIRAGTLAGAGLRETINRHYDNLFGFSATDDSSGSLTAATALKGTHSVASGAISGTLESDLEAFSNAYIRVKYVNVGGNVGYEIVSNSYLTDAVAKTAQEKAMAKIYDDLEYVEGDDAANAISAAKKRNFAALAGSGALAPQAVVRSARMNMALADAVHFDTLNRMSTTVDARKGRTNVSVRNINRFASYGGGGDISGSSDSISGVLLDLGYAETDKFFAGIALGGFYSKSSSNGVGGKAETQSLALNAYTNRRFLDAFDWYVGATCAFGKNEAERRNVLDTSKAEWDSKLFGVFTGVRYAWKPFPDSDFLVRPTVGVSTNVLLNPSFEESSGSERMSFESERYVSMKSLAGIEATCALSEGFYFTGRMFYTHEFGDARYEIDSWFASAETRTRGPREERNAVVLGAGVEYDISERLRVYADYAIDVSNDVLHSVFAGVRFAF